MEINIKNNRDYAYYIKIKEVLDNFMRFSDDYNIKCWLKDEFQLESDYYDYLKTCITDDVASELNNIKISGVFRFLYYRVISSDLSKQLQRDFLTKLMFFEMHYDDYIDEYKQRR